VVNILGEKLESKSEKLTYIDKKEDSTKQKNTTLIDSKLRILLAEDNVVNQKVALKQLQNIGCKADIAANGQEVLQLLTKIPYDLVFMDCQMPILDGFDATKQILSWQENKFAAGHRPVVIAMTANAMKEDRQKCIDAGMDDYISKPVSKEKLENILQLWNYNIQQKAQEKNLHLCIDSSITNILDVNLLNRENISIDAIINWQHLHQLSENNSEFELELLEIFVSDVPSHLASVKDAIAVNDCLSIVREAHHIKGSAANIGAEQIHLSAEKIERLALEEKIDNMMVLVNTIEEQITQIQEFLKAQKN
jgi:CheY-like chemotaxis protein